MDEGDEEQTDKQTEVDVREQTREDCIVDHTVPASDQECA
jgi:hypothetical protein